MKRRFTLRYFKVCDEDANDDMKGKCKYPMCLGKFSRLNKFLQAEDSFNMVFFIKTLIPSSLNSKIHFCKKSIFKVRKI